MIILHLHLDSAPQCMAYILDKWPLSVLLVRIWMRPIGTIEPAAWAKVVSQAALRPSYYVYFGIVQKTAEIAMGWNIQIHHLIIICLYDSQFSLIQMV